jgi:hypothetical protein
MGGVRSTRGRDDKCIKILVRKLDGKRPLGTPTRRWEDNITMDLRETRCEDVDWMLWLKISTSYGLL